MSDLQTLSEQIQDRFGNQIHSCKIACKELTIEVEPKDILEICQALRDGAFFRFEMLMDLSGVDYLHYGIGEWTTDTATRTGFSRGVEEEGIPQIKWDKPRFAVVYHLLSITHNHRLRLKTFISDESLIVPSVVNIWNSANWYEREVFDLFGLLFEGHPDLRRILTDYGFMGHPFRKDFPLIGTVEMRYSAREQRVIYEPVSIEPRTLVPKTIRSNHPVEQTEPNLHG